MAEDKDPATRHDEARDLTEKALDMLVEGKEKEADALIERAKAVDVTAVKEVVDEMDEDAEARKSTGG